MFCSRSSLVAARRKTSRLSSAAELTDNGDPCSALRLHRISASRAHGTKLKTGKETVHREGSSKSVRLMNAVLARQNSGKYHMRRHCTKKDAPAKQREIWRKTFTSSRIRTTLCFFMFLVKSRQCRRPLQRDQRSKNSQLIQEHRST